MNRQTQPLELKFEASEAGLIEGYASLWGGAPDAYGDLVSPGAYSASLAEHRRRGTQPVMLWSHDQSRPIGTWIDVHEDGTGLAVRGKLAIESAAGREAHALLKAGALSGLSIGYVERKATQMPDGTRRLEAIDLHEVSVVALPAASGARITAVKAQPEVSPRWLIQTLRDAGLSKGLAEGIVRNGWRGALDESSEAEAAQVKRIIETLKTATQRIYK